MGWQLDCIYEPNAINISLTLANANSIEENLDKDLIKAVELVNKIKNIVKIKKS